MKAEGNGKEMREALLAQPDHVKAAGGAENKCKERDSYKPSCWDRRSFQVSQAEFPSFPVLTLCGMAPCLATGECQVRHSCQSIMGPRDTTQAIIPAR